MEPIEILKQIYKEKFNIDEVLVDLMADRDILHLTASGSSNISISKFLDIDIEDIKSVNKDFYGFDGWETDLDLNPIGIYNNMVKMQTYSYEIFYHEISTISPYFDEDTIQKMYEICSKFHTIDKLLEEEWN